MNIILMEKNLLTDKIVETDNITNVAVRERAFDLDGLNQMQLWAKNITTAVIQNKEDIEKMKAAQEITQAQIADIIAKNTQQEQENASLKETLRLLQERLNAVEIGQRHLENTEEARQKNTAYALNGVKQSTFAL